MAKPLQIAGLKGLREDLKVMGPAATRELRIVLKGGAQLVAERARELAPLGTRAKPPEQPVHLRDSIKAGTLAATALVYSRLPYANLIHWGGNVPSARSSSSRPRRHFDATLFMTHALEDEAGVIVGATVIAIQDLARQHGFRD